MFEIFNLLGVFLKLLHFLKLNIQAHVQYKSVNCLHFIALVFIIDKIEREKVRVPHLRPEPLDSIRMEDLIKDYLTSKDNVCTSLLRVGQIIF